MALPDSPEAWLNAGSKLVYEAGFGVGNRNTTGQVLSALQLAFDFTFTKKGKHITVTR